MSDQYDDEMRDQVAEALVRRGRVLSAERKGLDEEIKAILSRLDDLTPVGWTLTVDGVPARKQKGSRSFSPELAIARFTPEQLASCAAEGLDPKKVAEMASQLGIKEACMAESDTAKASVRLT